MPETVPDTPESALHFRLQRYAGAHPEITTARELFRRVLRPIEYLVRDMITEGAHLVAGRPKTGKSWFVLQLGLAVSEGDLFLGKATRPGAVLYIAGEDSDRRMRQRISRLVPDLEGAWPANFHYATWWPRMPEGGEDLILAWLYQHPDAALVIIDTLAKVRARRSAADQIYDADYAVGESIKRITAAFPGVAVLAVTHTRKADAADALDTISGSTGLTGSFDGAIVLQRERGADQAVLAVISRDLEGESEWGIEWDKHLTCWRLVGTAAEVQATDTQRRIVALLRAAEAPMRPVTIATELRLRRDSVRHILRRMREAGLVIRTGKEPATSYTLPSHPSHPSSPSHTSQASQEGGAS